MGSNSLPQIFLSTAYRCWVLNSLPDPFIPGVIVSIDLDPRELVDDNSPGGYRVVHLVYPPSRVVVFIQSAFDAGLHIPPMKRGEIAVGVETRTFDVKGHHDKLFAFKRAQLPLLPGHLSSVYRAQVTL